jgi:GNAT superfamily N-acetyltransferase
MHASAAIRSATEGDLPGILRLYAEDDTLWRGEREGAVALEATGGAPTTPTDAHVAALRAIQADRNNELYVAEREGAVVGTFQLTFIRQLSYGGCLVAQVESVFVRSSERSSGVGRQMMEHARREAERRGALRIQLTSNVARERAHRFYERLGYRATHKGMKLYLERSPRERTTER